MKVSKLARSYSREKKHCIVLTNLQKIRDALGDKYLDFEIALRTYCMGRIADGWRFHLLDLSSNRLGSSNGDTGMNVLTNFAMGWIACSGRAGQKWMLCLSWVMKKLCLWHYSIIHFMMNFLDRTQMLMWIPIFHTLRSPLNHFIDSVALIKLLWVVCRLGVRMEVKSQQIIFSKRMI